MFLETETLRMPASSLQGSLKTRDYSQGSRPGLFCLAPLRLCLLSREAAR
jgi:hypothetical protein